jgi:AcrR family transcriptional regulator
MRERIKALAVDLLIQHGYRGTSFGDLAEPLNITRPNIHYHFGSKQNLVEEVLDDYIRATLKQLRVIWTEPGITLLDRIERTTAHSRNRYLKYNPTEKTGRPWSLITRLRQDVDALTPKSRNALQRYGRDLNAIVSTAVREAIANGEFVSWMPVDDVALQIVAIANSGGSITQDASSFERLEQLYSSFGRIITLAFGTKAGRGTRKSRPEPEVSETRSQHARDHRTGPRRLDLPEGAARDHK